MGADDHLVLAKEFLQFNSVVLPLCTIERLHHNFDHDDVIASDSASAVPEAFGRRTTVRSEAAEPVGQLRSDIIVMLCWEGPTRIVISRQKDLHEVWHGSLIVRGR